MGKEGGVKVSKVKICELCGGIFGLSLEGSECPNLECRGTLADLDVTEQELANMLDGQGRQIRRTVHGFDYREGYE